MARDRLRFPFTRVTPPTYSPPCSLACQGLPEGRHTDCMRIWTKKFSFTQTAAAYCTITCCAGAAGFASQVNQFAIQYVRTHMIKESKDVS